MFGLGRNAKREDDDSFVRRIRQEITDKTCQTSGICVFEHKDENDLDDSERKILENLRVAHEKWVAEHGTKEEKQDSNAYKSVKMRI